MSKAKWVNVIPGPWIAERVTRPDAGQPLFNAVVWADGQRTESDRTPTHSHEGAWLLASELNLQYHQAHEQEIPEGINRWASN